MTVNVTILDDDPAATPPGVPEGEPTETFTLELKNEAGASVETRSATCEILDDEVEVSVGPASADEGDGTLTFTVALDGVPTADVDIGYRLVDHARATHDAQRGGATDTCASPGYPVDYLPLDAIGPPTPPPDAALVISPSTPNQQANLAVTICDDTVAEPDETFWLEIEVQGGEAIVETDGGAVGTITDDDTLAISVDDVSAVEGATLEFEVGLEVGGNPTSLVAPVTLDYAIEEASPVSATAGTDYEAASGQPLTGSLTFQNDTCSVDPQTHTTQTACENVPGATWIAGEQTLRVNLLADYEVEGDETFLLKLSDTDGSTHGLSIADAEATGTITDDPPPYVSVRGFSGPEGSTQSFTVSLDEAPRSGDTVTVGYAIEAAGTCSVGSHPDEAACTGATPPGIWTPPATEGDDYDAPGMCTGGSGSTRSECEGNGGTWTETTPLSGTVTFNSGETTKTVPVDLLADYLVEGDETFRIVLSDPDKAALNPVASAATGTITDDPPPSVSVRGFAGPEGSTQSFTVSLDEAPRSGDTVMVGYAIEAVGTCSAGSHSTRSDCEGAGGTWTDPATAGADYDAPGTCSVGSHSTRSACEGAGETWTVTTPLTGSVSFGSGETTKTVPVDLLADYEVEADETFGIVLSDPVKAVLDSVAFAATGTITDDPPPSVSVRGFSGPEGSTQSFTVSLDEAPRSGDTVMVGYEIVAVGTCSAGSHSTRSDCEGAGETWTPPATAGADYDAPGTCSVGSHSARSACEGAGETWTVTTPLIGTLSFNSGETSKTVPVRLLADTVLEVVETFRIVLRDPVKAVLDSAASEAAATITDVDPTKLTVDDPTKKEGETLVFTVELEAPRDGQSVTVDYEVQNRSAKAGRDFTAIDPLTGDLTLSDTTSTATVSVQLLSDTIAENDETLHLVLSNVQSASSVGLAKSIGVGTIKNVNPASVRVTNAVAVVEGDALQFVISLTDDARNPAEIVEDVTVYYESEDADPDITGRSSCTVAGADYVSQARTSVTFDAADADDREHTVTVHMHRLRRRGRRDHAADP